MTTALGRAMLAHRRAGRSGLAGYLRAAGDGVVDADRAWQVIERARSTGYATEEQENEVGISCVAVPLLRSGVAIAAVSITAPAERMTPERIIWLREKMSEVLPALLPDGLHLPQSGSVDLSARLPSRGPPFDRDSDDLSASSLASRPFHVSNGFA